MGMTLASRLLEQDQEVTIFESAGTPGGLTSSWEIDNFTWDKFYHVILMSDLHTRAIIKQIGIEKDFKWVETKTGFYAGGKLYSMSNLLEFFKFPPINIIDKFRLGVTIFVASKIKNWRKLEKIPVERWLNRWSGKRVFNKIWLPLLKAKLGDYYKQTSAAFIWATIQRMYAARKTGLKKEMFGYISGGYDKINKAFARYLIEKGAHFKLNAKVIKIAKSDKGITVDLTSEKGIYFDKVISTLSAWPSVKIAPELPAWEVEKHTAIKYLGVVCPSVVLKEAVSPYYVTNIIESWPPFTGIIEMTALIDREEINGKHLVYLPKYVAPGHELFDKEDDKVEQDFLDALLEMYPHLNKEDVLTSKTAKARLVFALPTLDYSSRVPGIKTSIPNYYIINSSQIINGTLNVNETIQVAEKKLKDLFDEQEK